MDKLRKESGWTTFDSEWIILSKENSVDKLWPHYPPRYEMEIASRIMHKHPRAYGYHFKPVTKDFKCAACHEEVPEGLIMMMKLNINL